MGAGCTTRSPSAILGIQAGAITRPAFDLKQLLDRQHELYMFSSKQLVYLHDDDDAGAKVSVLKIARLLAYLL